MRKSETETEIIQSDHPLRRRPIIGFVHIPKTAGTTVKFILRNSTYLRHCDIQARRKGDIFNDDDFNFARKIFFFGLRSIAGHSLICPTAHLTAPVQYFTFVRDPLQRCLSNYQQIKRARRKHGGDITFEAYMRIEDVADHQVRRIAGGPNLPKAMQELTERYLFVGLTERFAESMLVLQRLCPYSLRLEYTRLHVTSDNRAKQEVLSNPDYRRLLQDNHQLDLQLYAYVRDELYPALRKKAGLSAECELDEKRFLPASFPLRYKLTRGYNNAVYRTLIKLRRGYIDKPNRPAN